jgi:hypothetical protein
MSILLWSSRYMIIGFHNILICIYTLTLEMAVKSFIPRKYNSECLPDKIQTCYIWAECYMFSVCMQVSLIVCGDCIPENHKERNWLGLKRIHVTARLVVFAVLSLQMDYFFVFTIFYCDFLFGVWNGVHSASWGQLRSYLNEKVAAPV